MGCPPSLRTVILLSDDLGAEMPSQQLGVGFGSVVEIGIVEGRSSVAIIGAGRVGIRRQRRPSALGCGSGASP